MDVHADYISLPRVPAFIPQVDGEPVSYQTVLRWARHGVMGVKLKTYRVACRLVTTRDDVDAFLRAVEKRADARLEVVAK